MSGILSPITLFTAAVLVAWLLWNLRGKVSSAKSLPSIPLVEFDGDNSRERHTSEAGSLLSKGCEMTLYFRAAEEKLPASPEWPVVLYPKILELFALMDSYRANGKSVTPNETVQNIFIVMFASMHGTSFIALQSLFSLLGTPGALTEIREEIERVAEKELKDSPV
ncbi:hypothetical protein F4677DRAFT_439515 [Hypoxylon crocopeplum]|nr:hypothetical protein F4677DRAFT_439515 [Hypoxylon crocopeplum]